MSINKVSLSGRLTHEPEYNGKVLTFPLAVNRSVRDGDGNWKEQPDYPRCVVFGKRAESLSSILKKGTEVMVDGRLRWSDWDDKETGEHREKVEVIVNDLEFLSPRG